MSTTPCTIVVFSEDPENLPAEHITVVMKQLFQYGVLEIKRLGDKVFVSLKYCPRGSSLKRKFGNLPIRYIRTKLDNEAEFKILESVVRRFRFNLVEEDVNEVENLTSPKKRVYIEPPVEEEDEDLMDDVIVINNAPSTSQKQCKNRRRKEPVNHRQHPDAEKNFFDGLE